MSIIRGPGQTEGDETGNPTVVPVGAAAAVWAKSRKGEDSWLALWRHLDDTAAVAIRLYDRWVPDAVRRLIGAGLPEGIDDGRLLAGWLAGIHDIGKATPAFAVQVPALADRMRATGLEMRNQGNTLLDRSRAPHATAGQLILHDWLVTEHGWQVGMAHSLGVIVGGHHGLPPTAEELGAVRDRPHLLGWADDQRRWRQVQDELLERAAITCGAADRLTAWATTRLTQQAQVLLSSIVIVADWIASNDELFPYDWDSTDPAERLERAWRGLDLPAPWQPDEPPAIPALFTERFPTSVGDHPRPVQVDAVELATAVAAPGLLLIEAPMGEGKTEAALAVAEVFASRAGAGGCFIALPTMATSDAMFERVLGWLKLLPRTDMRQTPRSVFLAHGKATMNRHYQLLAQVGDFQEVNTDSGEPFDGVMAHQWLQGRKKGVLSSFVVGTIDQILFAGLKSRHLALRHLSLAGKVVIIDEVHAYDAYMSTYLDRVMNWLGAYRVPTILLSATLPPARRAALINAYDSRMGIPPRKTRPPRMNRASRPAEFVGDGDVDYPVLVATSGTGAPIIRGSAPSGRGTAVTLRRIEDDLESLCAGLDEVLSGGGCVLIVRNTVARVQETAEALRDRFGHATVSIAHSRFIDADRVVKDRWLRDTFGPPEVLTAAGTNRPLKHIVVASQVAEQSLDIDFDLLITDVAPVDLLLQRVGRLDRHPRARPGKLRAAQCWLAGVDWESVPPRPVAGSRAVYGNHLLLRSLAVLDAVLAGDGTIQLPGDIAPLVRDAYGTGELGPATWQKTMATASAEHDRIQTNKEARASTFRVAAPGEAGEPILGWVHAGVGDADDTALGLAQVRDTTESLEVLLVVRRNDGTMMTLPWLESQGGVVIPTDRVPEPALAQAIAGCAIRLPHQFSAPWMIDRARHELAEVSSIPSWQRSSWLRGQFILALDEDFQASLVGQRIRYTPEKGLTRPEESFNLVDRPWIRVQDLRGAVTDVSLLGLFERAHELRAVLGDLPTQAFALTRLALAILHRAVHGPQGVRHWTELWNRPALPVEEIACYLNDHRDRFDLLHDETPFFQVADLRAARGDMFGLQRFIGDVPNGAPLFTNRIGDGLASLSYAEAARWLVHCHAYDPSGIKSGAVGDPRVKCGKGYPIGVAWTGNLGGILLEGSTLRETLLLNLVAWGFGGLAGGELDLPPWERDQLTACEELEGGRPARGPVDLYTWQSRRVRLFRKEGQIIGAMVANGDRLAAQNQHAAEPGTGWRRSRGQEQKLARPLVYMPRIHFPERAMWRGLASLLPSVSGRGQCSEGADALPPLVLEWVGQLRELGAIPRGYAARARAIGATYGSQQAVIQEVVDDELAMNVALLAESNRALGGLAADAAADADAGADAVATLAGNLDRAAGGDGSGSKEIARAAAFAELDGAFRSWLATLDEATDVSSARTRWHQQAKSIIRVVGNSLVELAGPTAWVGRTIGGKQINTSLADLWFTQRLDEVFSLAQATATTPR